MLAGIVAVEIFLQDLIGALADARTKGVADTDAFPRRFEGSFDASRSSLWFCWRSFGRHAHSLPSGGAETIAIWRERNQAGAVSRDRSEAVAGKVRYRACSVCRGGCEEEFASLRGISRPCGGQYQWIRAIVPRWYRQDRSWHFRIDQLLDVVADRLRRMASPPSADNRGGEEVFQLEAAAIGRHIFCWR